MTPVPTEPTGSSVRRTNSGAGRVLVALYGIFALAATARATVQLLTKFEQAPLAYLLSLLAGQIYIVATITLARGTRASRRLALIAIIIELVGVLTIGTLSVVCRRLFHAPPSGLCTGSATASCHWCYRSWGWPGCGIPGRLIWAFAHRAWNPPMSALFADGMKVAAAAVRSSSVRRRDFRRSRPSILRYKIIRREDP